jgi:glutathione synthase/RimK-type ligase-like ATP-grasp enzyme
MQSGEYIVDRLMPDILRTICKPRGITVATYSDEWLIEMTKGDLTVRTLGYKWSLNDAAASEIAQDKVAAAELMAARDVTCVPHYLIRTRATEASWAEWQWGSGMVIKPLTGTSGHGVKLITSSDKVQGWMEQGYIEAWAASPFVSIEREIRIIVCDDDILLAYQKLPVIKDGLKMFNLGQGATPKAVELTNDHIALARRTMKALGLRLAAIDIIQTADGVIKVLEVNDGFMMEHYARFSPQNKEKVISMYEAIIDHAFTPKTTP